MLIILLYACSSENVFIAPYGYYVNDIILGRWRADYNTQDRLLGVQIGDRVESLNFVNTDPNQSRIHFLFAGRDTTNFSARFYQKSQIIVIYTTNRLRNTVIYIPAGGVVGNWSINGDSLLLYFPDNDINLATRWTRIN